MAAVRANGWWVVLVVGMSMFLLAWYEPTRATKGALVVAQLLILGLAASWVTPRTAVHRWGWWVLLAGGALNVALNTEQAAANLQRELWLGAPAVIYAAFLTGMISLLGVRRARPTEQNLMDTGIVAAGLMVIGWAFLIVPRVGNQLPQAHHVAMGLGFAALDLLMTAILVRIAFTPSPRTPPLLLVGFAGFLLLVGHVTAVFRAGPDALSAWDGHGTAYVTAQLSALLVAAAAMHPGYCANDRASDDDGAELFPRRRLALFIAVAVITPFVPVIGLLSNVDLVTPKAIPAVIGSAALTCLVMVLLVLRLGNFAHLAVRRAEAMDTQSGAMLVQARSLQQALDDQHALQNELAHRALHDPLTGLANRVLLAERLNRMLRVTARRDGGLLLIDLDGFKEVNDTLGHPVGDELLTRVAQRLCLAGGPEDVVARLGGDEFAMLMVDADADGCRSTAQRVIESIREVYHLGDRRPIVTSSAGLLILGPSHDDPAEALRDVDLALYAAKQAGRNQAVEFDPAMREAHVRHAELAATVRAALDERELTIHYQPIVDLASGRIMALEALLRWRVHGGQPVTPSQFIAVAEDIGLIGDVGSEVLRSATEQARQWHTRHGISVSVNISGRQLASPTFAAEVLDAIDASGLEPDALIIEITETVLIDATKPMGVLAMASLQRLRERGIRIAVDDFGTGYSSLAYLEHLPIDILKIDQMFTSTLDSPSERNIRFVGAILGLGASLGLPIVAEGVETSRQANVLRDLGCEFGQGFHFAKPCPADEVRELIETSFSGEA